MLKLIIEDDEGRKTVVPFVRDEITIGRQEGNTIRLTERNVSRRHARLLRQNGHVHVEDLGSYNGIRLNGEKITGRAQISDGDLIQIGDYDLAIQHEGTDHAPPHAPAPPAEAHGHGAPQRTNGVSPAHEPVTEAMAPAFEEAEPISGEEDTAKDERPAAPAPEVARRQSTSVIRVEQVESSRKRELKELDPEEAPRLVVLNGEFAGREFACIRTELRIGRTDDNDISLDHRSLSRTHAKLVREDNGEWRVIDMQSANGLTVNGEPYAQATLNHLDTIELGHLQLKFVAAGESYTFVPGSEGKKARGGASKSRAPLFIGLAVVVAGAGAGAYFAFGGATPTTPAPQPPEQLAQAPRQPAVQPPVKVTDPEPPAPSEPEAGVAAAAEAKQKIDQARSAMSARDFDRAVELLDQARAVANVPNGVVDDINDLLDQAKAEQMLRQRLDDAEKALAAGKLDEATELLDQAAATAAFQDRYKVLADRLEKKVAEAEKKTQLAAAKQVKERSEKPERPPKESKPSQSEDAARKLFEEGLALFNKKQHREAKTVFTRCLESDPSYAKCHLMLGSTYARLKDVDQGARHYDLFLKLAPNAPEAPKVKYMLEQYRSSKRGTNSN